MTDFIKGKIKKEVSNDKLFNNEQAQLEFINLSQNRLEKMKVLERKQLALGFNEYVCSDEFKLKIKNYNDNRRQFFCEKIRQNEISDIK